MLKLKRMNANEWAPVHSSISGARHLRFCEGNLVHTSVMSGSAERVAFALRSRGYIQIFGYATRLAAAVHLNCAGTLPLSKVTGITRWRHAPLQEWTDGHPSVPAACSLDDIIGMRMPAKRGAGRSETPAGAAPEMLRQIQASVKLHYGRRCKSLCSVAGTKRRVPVSLSGRRLERDQSCQAFVCRY